MASEEANEVAGNPRVDFWAKKWDMYSEKDITPGFHRPVVNSLLLEHADKLFPSGDTVDKDATILVPLCGK